MILCDENTWNKTLFGIPKWMRVISLLFGFINWRKNSSVTTRGCADVHVEWSAWSKSIKTRRTVFKYWIINLTSKKKKITSPPTSLLTIPVPWLPLIMMITANTFFRLSAFWIPADNSVNFSSVSKAILSANIWLGWARWVSTASITWRLCK